MNAEWKTNGLATGNGMLQQKDGAGSVTERQDASGMRQWRKRLPPGTAFVWGPGILDSPGPPPEGADYEAGHRVLATRAR